MTLRAFALAAMAVLLAACSTAPTPETPDRAANRVGLLPPMKMFRPARAPAPLRPNSEITRDFLDLAFEMESGRQLERMTRFEGPIRVRVTGSPPPSLSGDLDRLVARLRSEAGIDISRSSKADAEITIEAIPRRILQRQVPEAACFVVPNVSGLSDYRGQRRSPETNWALLTERRQITIFLPSDQSPQEVRDCLHEELAQAIGPLNDLYRLPDSVFNDDNFHNVLTGFDMLILRTYYAPELRNGMTRAEAARAVPRILARLNPGGQRGAARPLSRTPRLWVHAIETALGSPTFSTRRRAAAAAAVEIATEERWDDSRRAFSHYAFGRLSLNADPELALASFLAAEKIYSSRPETRVQAAHVAVQLSAFTLTAGQPQATLDLVTPYLPVAARAENAALLATLLMFRAEALDLLDRPGEAQAVRLDSLGWARYGLGSEKAVRARLNEVRALSPKSRGS